MLLAEKVDQWCWDFKSFVIFDSVVQMFEKKYVKCWQILRTADPEADGAPLHYFRGQFHQHSTSSFYGRRSQKIFFYAFGIFKRKSCTKNVDEIDTRSPQQTTVSRGTTMHSPKTASLKEILSIQHFSGGVNICKGLHFYKQSFEVSEVAGDVWGLCLCQIQEEPQQYNGTKNKDSASPVALVF